MLVGAEVICLHTALQFAFISALWLRAGMGWPFKARCVVCEVRCPLYHGKGKAGFTLCIICRTKIALYQYGMDSIGKASVSILLEALCGQARSKEIAMFLMIAGM